MLYNLSCWSRHLGIFKRKYPVSINCIRFRVVTVTRDKGQETLTSVMAGKRGTTRTVAVVFSYFLLFQWDIANLLPKTLSNAVNNIVERLVLCDYTELFGLSRQLMYDFLLFRGFYA